MCKSRKLYVNMLSKSVTMRTTNSKGDVRWYFLNKNVPRWERLMEPHKHGFHKRNKRIL